VLRKFQTQLRKSRGTAAANRSEITQPVVVEPHLRSRTAEVMEIEGMKDAGLDYS